MRRSPFALASVCSPGWALAAEVQAAGRGAELPQPVALPSLGLGALGGAGRAGAICPGHREGTWQEGGCLLSGKEEAFWQPPEHNPAGRGNAGGCSFLGAWRQLAGSQGRLSPRSLGAG